MDLNNIESHYQKNIGNYVKKLNNKKVIIKKLYRLSKKLKLAYKQENKNMINTQLNNTYLNNQKIIKMPQTKKLNFN